MREIPFAKVVSERDNLLTSPGRLLSMHRSGELPVAYKMGGSILKLKRTIERSDSPTYALCFAAWATFIANVLENKYAIVMIYMAIMGVLSAAWLGVNWSTDGSSIHPYPDVLMKVTHLYIWGVIGWITGDTFSEFGRWGLALKVRHDIDYLTSKIREDD